MKKLTIGILAHVDAGKTTLAEAMLYHTGVLRKMGRVDHKDTLMDAHPLEQNRGITIFTGQAKLNYGNLDMTLLDTPGHVDFSAETERTLQVLDYAVLVISGTEGIQSHTLTLWRLLDHYHIPTFIYITKMDFARRDRESLMEELCQEFGSGCVDFGLDDIENRNESIAMTREDILESYLDTGDVTDRQTAETILSRDVFPCYFGSGLKLTGVEELLIGLDRYTLMPQMPTTFGAKVYRITRDDKNNRLTHMKLTGGSLKVKECIQNGEMEEKINQIRVYSGQKYITVDHAAAGDIVAVTGLTHTESGQGLGFEEMAKSPVLEPVMVYRVGLPTGCDPEVMLTKLKTLEEEDPQLKVAWHSHQKEIHIGVMGLVQIEILKSLIAERFGVEVEIDSGTVLYKETIANCVEGVGHYEPLRHYAEAHFILSPLPLGSGILCDSICSEDDLDRNWQRLILTHILEKKHIGVLTGSPITDIRITLAAGRAHIKHTEGGDFRQATYRGIRQGLMQAESKLLEPYYDFRLEIPLTQLGRAMNDIRARSGCCEDPIDIGGMMCLRGSAPVTTLGDYAKEVAAYTGGKGRLSLTVSGYGPCHNEKEVIESFAYNPEADLENTPDSVFCSHGGGYNVKWNLVHEHMHLPSVLAGRRKGAYQDDASHKSRVSEQEMNLIMERLFGKAQETQTIYRPREAYTETLRPYTPMPMAQTYIIDGYNVIFGWDWLKTMAQENIEDARVMLIRLLSDFSATENSSVICVFDGGKVKDNPGEAFDQDGISVVYTKENQTADAYIERLIHEMGKNKKVCVVTSDALIQLAAVHKGILRLSAREFENHVIKNKEQTTALLKTLNKRPPGQSVKELLLNKRQK